MRFLLILCSATCPRGRGKGVVVSCSLLDQQQSQQIINITQPLKTQAQATINQQYKFISMQRNTFIYMKSACINRPSAHHSHLPLFSFSYFLMSWLVQRCVLSSILTFSSLVVTTVASCRSHSCTARRWLFPVEQKKELTSVRHQLRESMKDNNYEHVGIEFKFPKGLFVPLRMPFQDFL